MNKKLLGVVSVLCLSLISCADTSELYKGNAYIGGDFLPNRYNHYDDGIKGANIEKTIELQNDASASARYFNGSGVYEKGSDIIGFGQAASWHPEDFQGLSWTPDIIDIGVGVWTDQRSLIGKAYGQTKKMTLINDDFGRGYLSKLYNGQIRCNNWSSYAIVELDQQGYGTLFPAELSQASYFAMAVRGGSDTYKTWEEGGKRYASWFGRVTTFDINVTFYKRGNDKSLVGSRFKLKNVKLQTNNSAEYTSLVGFYFNEVGQNFSTNGIVGMSVDYSIVEDHCVILGEDVYPSSDFDDGATYHTGLLMYEVFFPDSTWY